MTRLEKILSIAGDPIITSAPVESKVAQILEGRLGEELQWILARKNGFFAFESALHLFPLGAVPGVVDLEQWNSPDLWRDEYGDLAKDLFFFAEDIFGGQFCIHGNIIGYFDSETGEVEKLAESFEEWADKILADYEVLTGYPLAHEWQLRHGPIPNNHRLIPVQFFVTGGEYTVANLKLAEASEGMKIRGPFAQYIKDLPDGTRIEIKIIE